MSPFRTLCQVTIQDIFICPEGDIQVRVCSIILISELIIIVVIPVVIFRM